MLDYAYPILRTEQCLRDMYQALLKNDPDEAERCANKAHEYLIEAILAVKVVKRPAGGGA